MANNLFSQYKRLLSNMKRVVKENVYLVEDDLLFQNICIDRRDNDYAFYGIRKDEKGRVVFYASHGHSPGAGEPIDINALASRLVSYGGDRYNPPITPSRVKDDFLAAAKAPIVRHLIEKTRISPKRDKILNQLEQALTE